MGNEVAAMAVGVLGQNVAIPGQAAARLVLAAGAAGVAAAAVRNVPRVEEPRLRSSSEIKGTLKLTAVEKNERYPLRILPKTSIQHVKVILAAQYGIDMDNKHLIYKGQRIKDEKTLADYRMQSGDVIIIVSGSENGMLKRISLYDASLSGKLDLVRSYLVEGTSANSSNKRSKERTPLHAAAENGHEEIVRLLLREEADVNAKDSEGLTPLHLAALKGQVNVFRLLLNGGADINMKAKGMKVIHFAAIGGQVPLLEVLEPVCELGEKADSGLTPLHLAAKRGNLETVLWLVEQGVSFSLRDDRGNTAEDLARENGHAVIASYLYSWVLLQQRKFLQVVAQGKLVNIMSFFKAGVDVDCRAQEEDEWGLRAIHLAALYGHLDVVSALVLVGARREAEDDMGSTAVHYAAAGGHVDVLERLKNEGCKMDMCNNLNMTPLHFAAIRGKTEAASWLLGQGVPKNVRSNTGLSAADIAKKEGHFSLSIRLKERQSLEQRTKTSKGSSALVTIKKRLGRGGFGTAYLAAMNGREIVVKEIKLNSESEKDLIPDESEVQILKRLKHPNIVTFVGCQVHGNTLNILMEYCSGGDLAQRIKQQKARKEPFQEKLVVNWASKIASALHYIHRKEILHRDLKPENIFLSGSDSIKLGDFGLAKVIEEKKYATSIVGSQAYMSPETCSGFPYNEKSDMWSFGCILYEVASFQRDFIIFKLDKIPNTFNSEYKNLVSSLLEQEPSKRPSSSQVTGLRLFKTSRPKSQHQETYQRQLKEGRREIAQNTNNLMHSVLSH